MAFFMLVQLESFRRFVYLGQNLPACYFWRVHNDSLFVDTECVMARVEVLACHGGA